MDTPGQKLEVGSRLGQIVRLAVQPAVNDHGGIGAEHETVVQVARDRPGLAQRVLADDLLRLTGAALVHGRRMHLAQTKYGYLQIDSSALAEGRSCDPSPAKSKTEAGHCLSVLPDFKPLAAFGTEVANVHGVVSIPGRPYVAIQHEGHACPFGGITFAYIGDKETFSTYDRQTGQLLSPE